MGVYGDMLSFFPELFRTVDFWRRDPKLGGGYNPTEKESHRVIILTASNAEFQNKKATEYRALDFLNHDVMYTRASTPVERGMFLRHPDDGDIFVIDEPFDYAFTGGYRMWGIERIQGADGTNEQRVEIKGGVY